MRGERGVTAQITPVGPQVVPGRVALSYTISLLGTTEWQLSTRSL